MNDYWLADANLYYLIILEMDMNLTETIEGKEYIVDRLETDDEDLDAFLFSLGCFNTLI